MSIDASLPSAAVAPRRKRSVTAHPWFPALVALWFAALLGLSSLVLAPAMLERLVAASRIETLVAAAAPPLGQTARLLVAVGLAGLGGIFGLVLGRVLSPRSRRVAPVAPVDESLADDDHAEPAPGLRDRLARLTGQGDGPRDFDDLPRLRTRDRHPDAPGRKPLSADDAVVADVMVVEAAQPVEPQAEPAGVAHEVLDVPHPDIAEPVMGDSVSDDEPLELDAAVVEEPAASAGLPAPTSAPAQAPAPAPTPAAVAAIVAAPLDSLGIVQLTERLAIAMSDRRARDARRAEAARAGNANSGEPPAVLPSLAARQVVQPTAPAPRIGSDTLETGYSSLLGLSRTPADKAPVRPSSHTAEPVVRPGPFAAPAIATRLADNEDASPAAATPDKGAQADGRAANYHALKAALASLQQISGTR